MYGWVGGLFDYRVSSLALAKSLTIILVTTLNQAYKSFYGAAVFCLSNGGFLAERISDVDVALQFCNYSRGKQA